jgi:hypothetical protein
VPLPPAMITGNTEIDRDMDNLDGKWNAHRPRLQGIGASAGYCGK